MLLATFTYKKLLFQACACGEIIGVDDGKKAHDPICWFVSQGGQHVDWDIALMASAKQGGQCLQLFFSGSSIRKVFFDTLPVLDHASSATTRVDVVSLFFRCCRTFRLCLTGGCLKQFLRLLGGCLGSCGPAADSGDTTKTGRPK